MSGDHKGAAAPGAAAGAAADVPRDFLKSLPANAFTPRPVKVAATQMACGLDTAANVDKAEALVRKAAAQGAQIILIQELFEAVYWCQDQEGKLFDLAKPASLTENPLLARFSALSEELNVVLPLSFFERANQAHYNSLIVFDAGKPLGLYRKSHIPDGPGYQEKFYFNPGDTGFKVFNTRFGAIGVAICWDQWFPEAARCMALAGAELLFYPTAIGSEPQDSTLDSRHHWTRVMQGHAGANLVPVIASNRIGKEKDITFYGNSFIADSTGHLVAQASDNKEEILIATFDLEANRLKRQSWGVFRDRRPDLYTPITSLDGRTQVPGAVAAAAARAAPAPAVPDFMGWKPHGSVAAAAAAVKAAAAAGKSKAACNGTDAKKEDLSTPAKDGFRMPAEWEPHAATWLLWPHRPDNWRGNAGPARAAFAQVIAAIAKHEPVNVCARSEDWLACKQQLSGVPRVRVLEMASDDAWMRDIGPTFVRSDATGEVRGIDWQFNAWGGDNGGCYKSWAQDQAVKAKVLDVCGAQRYVSRLVMEGGSFHTDGEGTLLTTEECLLSPNRNPTCTRADIERELRVMLAVEKIIWLPRGVHKDDDTNGHIDNLACFAAPAKVVLTWTDDAKDPQHAISAEALRILESATDAKGRKLQVVKLLQPTPIIRAAADVQGLVDLKLAEPRAVGERLAGSYVNFYIANGAIVVPAFGDALHDAAAKKTLEAVFPDRVVEQVALGREILLGGGNIHCITQQQPAGRCAL